MRVELDNPSNVITRSIHFIRILLVCCNYKKAKYKRHWVYSTFAKTLVPLLLTTRQYLLIDIIFEYIGIDLHNSYAHCQL